MSPTEIGDNFDFDPEDFEIDPWSVLSGDVPEIELPDKYQSDEQIKREMQIMVEQQERFRNEILEPELNKFLIDVFTNAIQIEDKIGDIICHHYCDLEQITSFQISIISRLGFASKIDILGEILTDYESLKNFSSIIQKINFIKQVRNGFAHRKQGWKSRGTDAKGFVITLTKYEKGEIKQLDLDAKKRDKVREYFFTCKKDLEKIDLVIRRERNHIS